MKAIKTSITVMLMSVALSIQAEDCRRSHRGAGVLLYSTDQAGQRYVLLGYESGRGWSSFGGGPKVLETLIPRRRRCETPQETAVREGVQEMRNLIPPSTLAQLVQSAAFYPGNAGANDFVTFVAKIDRINTKPYYSTPVLARSGFTETSDIAWIALDQLVDRANGRARMTRTPNGKDLWGEFWQGLAKELREGWDLRLMSVSAAGELVDEGRSLVVVALVGADLHIRIFDASGEEVVDKAESELVAGAKRTALKQRLNPLPAASSLSPQDKQEIIANATSIAGHTLRRDDWRSLFP